MLGIHLAAGDETTRLNRIIQQSADELTRKDLDELLRLAKKYKPQGYDANRAKLAELYCGNQEDLTAAALQGLFPRTHRKMRTMPLNIVKPTATLDAQAYRQPPDRWVDVDGERPRRVLGEGGEILEEIGDVGRMDAFARLVELARLPMLMREFDRRCAAAGTLFIRRRLVVDPLRPEATCIDLCPFWPSSVWVLEDEAAPGDLYSAHCVIAAVGKHEDGVVYEVQKRRPSPVTVATDDGLEYVSAFQLLQITEKGRVLAEVAVAGLNHTWDVMHASAPHGALWLDVDRDLVAQQLSVNVQISQHLYREDFQGHSQKWATGNVSKLKGSALIGGPDQFTLLPGDVQTGEFRSDPDMHTLPNLEKIFAMFANARAHNPDQWATKPGPPLSGVSRSIRNHHADLKRDEQIENFRLFEESRLLPALIEMNDRWLAPLGINAQIGGVDVKPRVRFPPQREFEDPETKRLRASNMMRDGWITPRRAAVMGGAYRTEEEAAAAGVPDELLPVQSSAPSSRARSPQSEPPPEIEEGVADVGDGEE